MSALEIGKELAALCQQGKNQEAINKPTFPIQQEIVSLITMRRQLKWDDFMGFSESEWGIIINAKGREAPRYVAYQRPRGGSKKSVKDREA